MIVRRTLPLAFVALMGLAAVPALAQAPAVSTPQGRHPAAPHLDNEGGGSPTPHAPAGRRDRADGGGAPAHLHSEGGGQVGSHRPNAGPGQAAGQGPAAHLDNQAGDTPNSHSPGRGAP